VFLFRVNVEEFKTGIARDEIGDETTADRTIQSLNHVTVESVEPTYVAERRSNANVYVQHGSANINSSNVPRGPRNTTIETASSEDQMNSMQQSVQPIKL
jgi:hypothetical protein